MYKRQPWYSDASTAPSSARWEYSRTLFPGSPPHYFSQADEDTMIVFFGDHQPTTYVSNPILRNNKVNPETLTDEENLLKYKVPYVIWSCLLYTSAGSMSAGDILSV